MPTINLNDPKIPLLINKEEVHDRAHHRLERVVLLVEHLKRGGHVAFEQQDALILESLLKTYAGTKGVIEQSQKRLSATLAAVSECICMVEETHRLAMSKTVSEKMKSFFRMQRDHVQKMRKAVETIFPELARGSEDGTRGRRLL